MSELLIRRATERDLPALLNIYNHYIATAHYTFDIEPRTLAQRREWLAKFGESGRHQCFVAVRDGRTLGWTCSGPFKDRAAYDCSVETSVYLAPGEQGKGYGRRLYEALLGVLAREDVHGAFAGITQPNDASVALHKSLGYAYVGTYREVGRKFGKYWDVAWYGRAMAKP